MKTANWIVDECEDANGFSTIRWDDGTPNGDLDAQPIATVYEHRHAEIISKTPAMKSALETIRDMQITPDTNYRELAELCMSIANITLQELEPRGEKALRNHSHRRKIVSGPTR